MLTLFIFVCSLTASLISAVCILDCCCLPGPKKLKRLGVELGANLCQSLKKIVLRNFVNHTTILTNRFFLLLIKVPGPLICCADLRVESFYVIFLLAKTELRLSGQVGKQCMGIL